MSFVIPAVYPITDTSLTGLSHLEQVRRLAAGGATFIQLREKHASPKDFYAAAKAVMDYTRGSEIRIIINDRADIALALRTDGLHLGQDDLPPERARQILGAKAIIGFSTHNIEQAIAAARMPLDYIALGPIYSTTTKENPDPVIGLEGLKTVRDAIGDFPLVAIGGINLTMLNEVLWGGADSLALISALLLPAEKITENTRRFIERTQNRSTV